MEGTGDLCEFLREVKFEWKIKDFLLLSDKVDDCCESPEFLFSGATWKISIYLNGRTEHKSVGWIDLFITRLSAGIPITAEWSLCLKTVDWKSTDFDRKYTSAFNIKGSRWGYAKLLLRSELIKRKSDRLPSDVLTVICTLKNSEKNHSTGILELQQDLRKLFLNGNVSDVVLKVDDQEFQSHRFILIARSPVFSAMLTHDTKEKHSGVVDIPDIDHNTFSAFLNYLYTGSGEKVTSQNVLKLYTAADKYQVDGLKKVCLGYMLKDISVENFCDILTLSLRHVEKDLTEACSEFFIKNSLAIVQTSKWQIFLNENTVAGNELIIKKLQLDK